MWLFFCPQGNFPPSRLFFRSPWRRSPRSTRDCPWRTRSCCGSCTTGTCAAPRGPPRPPLSPSSHRGTPAPSPAPASHPDDAFWKLGDCPQAFVQVCGTDPNHTHGSERYSSGHMLTTRELESRHPQGSCGDWNSGGRLGPRPRASPAKISEWIYMDAVAQSTSRTRGSCSLPFSPKQKGKKNSQGPVKIKIYNLYNVLHHRHLLVIFVLV